MSSPLILAGLAALIAITLAAPEFQGKVPGEMQVQIFFIHLQQILSQEKLLS
jgi:hypothetical protein